MIPPLRMALLLGLALTAGSSLARADIFSYTDAQGITHFSNVPADSRYRLLLVAPAEKTESATSPRSGKWLAKSAAYDSMIESAALTHTIHAALIRAVIVVESGFNPRALSKRGAVGLMQLLPSTARRYGVSNIYDPAQNIRAGTHYLSDLMVRYDSNVNLVLAAYNAGENAVERYGGQIPPFKETQDYVPNVLRIYHALLAHQRASEHG